MSVHNDGDATVLGQLALSEPMLALTWPEVSEADDSVLISLASGAIMAVSAPVELLASGQCALGEGMLLGSRDVTTKVCGGAIFFKSYF